MKNTTAIHGCSNLRIIQFKRGKNNTPLSQLQGGKIDKMASLGDVMHATILGRKIACILGLETTKSITDLIGDPGKFTTHFGKIAKMLPQDIEVLLQKINSQTSLNLRFPNPEEASPLAGVAFYREVLKNDIMSPLPGENTDEIITRTTIGAAVNLEKIDQIQLRGFFTKEPAGSFGIQSSVPNWLYVIPNPEFMGLMLTKHIGIFLCTDEV